LASGQGLGKVPPRKEFHLDFGPGPSDLTSTIRVLVTGESAGSSGQGHRALVLAPLVRHKAEPLTTVTGDADPDKPEVPVDVEADPDDPAYAAMQNIKVYLQARHDFMETGKTYIAAALEIEKTIAEFYATGPLYELGGAALTSMLDKAHDLVQAVAELRAFASKARQEAIQARELAQAGKGLGKSAEEVAQEEAVAKEAEQAAAEARTQADEATKAADEARAASTQAQKDVQDAQTMANEVGPGTLLGEPKVQPDLNNLTDHALKSMQNRRWSKEEITEAFEHGQAFPQVNLRNGNPANRYVNPTTGKSVIIDNVTGEVIQVGDVNFSY